VLALALAVAASLSSQSPEVGRAVGQLFPELELPTIDGSRTVRLSELRGRRLLLIEFASW
jgi:hypothetical protein